jgi:AraC family transcriptional regulator
MAKLFIEDWERLASTAHYDATVLAKMCQLSVRQLQRDFRRLCSRTPQDWLNEQRLQAAQTLLLSGRPIKSIAFELGFKQMSHFCRQFKALYKVTPSQFINTYHMEEVCRPKITNVVRR